MKALLVCVCFLCSQECVNSKQEPICAGHGMSGQFAKQASDTVPAGAFTAMLSMNSDKAGLTFHVDGRSCHPVNLMIHNCDPPRPDVVAQRHRQYRNDTGACYV